MKIILFILSLFLSLFALNLFFLWVPLSVQVEGDVLIHLVLARNIATGHFFEYGIGQATNAGTSPLWEMILALTGMLSGTLSAEESFFRATRIISGFFLIISSLLFFKVSRLKGFGIGASIFLAAFIFCNPISLYWGLINPMETPLVLFFIAVVLLVLNRFSEGKSWRNGYSVMLAVLTLFIYLLRPEMVVLPVLGGCWLILGRKYPVRNLVFFFLCGLLVFSVAFFVFSELGGSLIPGASSSRRLHLKIFDTVTIPWVGWRVNLDAFFLGALFAPFIVALSIACYRERRLSGLKIPVLLSYFILTLFFSFIFCSTWKGRYLLPILSAVLVSAGPVEEIMLFLKKPVGKVLLIGYVLLLNGILLYPLVKHLPGYKIRASAESNASRVYYNPLDDEHSVMVLEVQGAYFYPELEFISLDGLIEGSLISALNRGLTFREYMLEMKPALVGKGPMILKDPEGLRDALDVALNSKSVGTCCGISFRYAGNLKGSGPVLRMDYD
ncbi:MAG: hypothetical protein PF692_06810 [Kiritimatiellae bacterium]|jgi:hypothetical protein|nr:hypothetical protein [Kiritimatiellia bacterium]